MIAFEVRGVPAPKGSSRAMVRGGKAVNVPSGSNVNRARLEDWRSSVSSAAALCTMHGRDPVTFPSGALTVACVYRFPLLAGHMNTKKTGPKESAPLYLPTGKDADKLNRATLDAITSAGCVWRDDAQVSISLAVRVYTPPGAWTGAFIMVAGCERGWEVVEMARERVVLIAQQMLAAKAAAVVSERLSRRRS